MNKDVPGIAAAAQPVNQADAHNVQSPASASMSKSDPSMIVDQNITPAMFFRVLQSISDSLARIADHLSPEPDNIVGTPHVAQRLGCTTTWVSEMIRDGVIPSSCILTGTGNGKPWKFHRDKIDAWLANR